MNADFRQNVSLKQAKILGAINLSKAVLGGNLTADKASTGADLFMQRIRGSSKNQGVTASLRLLHVGGSLHLDGAACRSLGLSGSRVEGELRLLSLNWSGDCSMILRNAYAATLCDSDLAWPRQVELEGFTYDRWGGPGENGDTRGAAWAQRNWYSDWFKKDHTYSPQPYEQLASVLRKMGDPAMANDVLYEGRERARREARALSGLPGRRTELFRFIGMTLLKWIIGYGLGLRYFRCLGWIFCLTALGWAVLQFGAPILDTNTGLTKAQLGFGDSLVFSLQKLVPLV